MYFKRISYIFITNKFLPVEELHFKMAVSGTILPALPFSHLKTS